LCRNSPSAASKKTKKQLEDSDLPSSGASISSLRLETRSRKRAAATPPGDAEQKKRTMKTLKPYVVNDDHESDNDTQPDDEEEDAQEGMCKTIIRSSKC
jgi:hypothetical protein